jgi:hypothetical protein
MTKEELIAEFISIDSLPNKTTFHVGCIVWDGHTPDIKWKKYSELDGEISDTIKDSQLFEILSDTKFFRVCKECSEMNPVGWMHDKHICQSCAEESGIVY